MKELNTNRSFLVAGCGGLGCYIVEGLLRLNVKKIVVCDPDIFSQSNLNRQLYSLPTNIGEYKVEIARKRAEDLNYQGEFLAYPSLFEKKMLEGIDVVFDALDNIEDRLKLEDYCSEKEIPLIHGAVEGNIYEAGVCLPHKNLLHNIYKDARDISVKETNVITVQTCAAKQLALAMSDLEESFIMEEIL
ncbi:MAG: ThiF family adenylyltransferase [Bacillota bacterium]|nr:ThiF family adenylyltransferase [Bacillota bacterium]